MKTIFLLRHAKSDWGDPDLDDHDRSLNKRGKRDAPRMGRLVREEKILPDLIITSDAKRAVQTVEALVAESGYTGEVKESGELYDADTEDYFRLLRDVPDEEQAVMLVGHNPIAEEFLRHLTGEETTIPTAALARVELLIEKWSELSGDTKGILKAVWRPKELP
jgi:phosphohistidine phosphatase